MYTKLIVGTDGSESGNKAVASAAGLARALGAELLILTATDPVETAIGYGGFGTFDAGPIIEQLESANAAQAKEILARASTLAAEAGVTAKTIHAPRQRPSDALLDTAVAEQSDLLVMGSHGRRGLQRLLLGSQAAQVVSRATIPVLVVR
jgi:nucleotide-binding universal stress UspA family protein